MTPKEQYEDRRAERNKLKDLDNIVRQKTETVMLLDMMDRFVTAVERIADSLAQIKVKASMRPRCIKDRCYSPVACGGFGYCRELNMRDDLKEWTREDDFRALLEAIDHTLSVHGHVDAGTPLHQRLRRTLELFQPKTAFSQDQ